MKIMDIQRRAIANRIKRARTDLGLTQQQVADKMMIDKSTYCGYETGKRQPDVQKIKQLSEILQKSVEFLLNTGTGDDLEEDGRIDLKYALFGDDENIDEDDVNDVLRYAQFIKQRKKETKK